MKLKLALIQLKKSGAVNIIFIIQLVLSCILLSYTFSIVSKQVTENNVLKDCNVESLNYIHSTVAPNGVTPIFLAPRETMLMTDKQAQLNERYPDTQMYFGAYSSLNIPGEEWAQSATIYPPQAKNMIRLPLSAGKWFSDVEPDKDGAIDVIVSRGFKSNLKIGEKYNVSLRDYSGLDSKPPQKMAVRVIGYLNYRNMRFDFTSNTIYGMLTDKYDIIIMCPQNTEDITVPLDISGMAFSAGPTDNSVPTDKMVDEYRGMREIDVFQAAILTTVMVILTIIGISSALMLKNTEEKRRYGTYYFSGASRKDCLTIEFIKALFITIPTLLICAGFFIWSAKQPSATTVFYNDMIFYGIAATMAMFFIPTMLNTLSIARTNPIESMRGD